MKVVAIFLLFFISMSGSAGLAGELNLNEFQYDGCTLFPEGTAESPNLWAHCCLQHDFFYWAGGTKIQRLQADKDLRQCFRDIGRPRIADLVYIAVRAGRLYPFPFKTQQWGNAWSVKRNYRCYNESDLNLVYGDLEQYNLEDELKAKLLASLIEAADPECQH